MSHRRCLCAYLTLILPLLKGKILLVVNVKQWQQQYNQTQKSQVNIFNDNEKKQLIF